MTDVLVNSDNVGMSFIAQRLGGDTMYDYLDKFGIGKLTEIDLQGESNIKLRKKEHGILLILLQVLLVKVFR